MTRDVLTVEARATLGNADARMAARGVGAALVLDDGASWAS
jgi:CBS domain-containing protein